MANLKLETEKEILLSRIIFKWFDKVSEPSEKALVDYTCYVFRCLVLSCLDLLLDQSWGHYLEEKRTIEELRCSLLENPEQEISIVRKKINNVVNYLSPSLLTTAFSKVINVQSSYYPFLLKLNSVDTLEKIESHIHFAMSNPVYSALYHYLVPHLLRSGHWGGESNIQSDSFVSSNNIYAVMETRMKNVPTYMTFEGQSIFQLVLDYKTKKFFRRFCTDEQKKQQEKNYAKLLFILIACRKRMPMEYLEKEVNKCQAQYRKEALKKEPLVDELSVNLMGNYGLPDEDKGNDKNKGKGLSSVSKTILGIQDDYVHHWQKKFGGLNLETKKSREIQGLYFNDFMFVRCRLMLEILVASISSEVLKEKPRFQYVEIKNSRYPMNERYRELLNELYINLEALAVHQIREIIFQSGLSRKNEEVLMRKLSAWIIDEVSRLPCGQSYLLQIQHGGQVNHCMYVSFDRYLDKVQTYKDSSYADRVVVRIDNLLREHYEEINKRFREDKERIEMLEAEGLMPMKKKKSNKINVGVAQEDYEAARPVSFRNYPLINFKKNEEVKGWLCLLMHVIPCWSSELAFEVIYRDQKNDEALTLVKQWPYKRVQSNLVRGCTLRGHNLGMQTRLGRDSYKLYAYREEELIRNKKFYRSELNSPEKNEKAFSDAHFEISRPVRTLSPLSGGSAIKNTNNAVQYSLIIVNKKKAIVNLEKTLVNALLPYTIGKDVEIKSLTCALLFQVLNIESESRGKFIKLFSVEDFDRQFAFSIEFESGSDLRYFNDLLNGKYPYLVKGVYNKPSSEKDNSFICKFSFDSSVFCKRVLPDLAKEARKEAEKAKQAQVLIPDTDASSSKTCLVQ